MALRVIGTGFGRTGTESMRFALNKLGFGPCHHMHEVRAHSEQLRLWRAKAAGEDIPWAQLFEGFQSAVDWPSAYFWRDLVRDFPDAKVLLTTRTPESWYNSINKTILEVARNNDDPNSLVETLIRHGTFDGQIDDPDHVMDVFRRHEEEVRETIPAERLLVYSVGSGWEPLCDFLGVPVPDEPFPKTNNTAQFIANATSLNGGEAP